MALTNEKTIRSLVDFCNDLQEPKTVITWDSTVARCAKTAEMFRACVHKKKVV